MSLATARLLMRASTAARAHAAGHTTLLGLAATYTRCAPLAGSLIHDRRGFASAAAPSDAPHPIRFPAMLHEAIAEFTEQPPATDSDTTAAAAVAPEAASVSASSPVSPSSHTSSPAPASGSAADNVTVHSQLRVAMEAGDAAAAQRIISAFEQSGGRCDVAMLTQWLSCHENKGDLEGAERVWTRFGELGLQPDRSSYRALLHVFTTAGGAQVVKIDPLLSSMHAAGLALTRDDYAQLLQRSKAAHDAPGIRCWLAASRASGLFEGLTNSRSLVRFAQRQRDAEAAIQRWSSRTDEQKREFSVGSSNALAEIISKLQLAQAEAIVADCDRLGITLDAPAVHAWLGCCRAEGDWQAAERAWARISKLNLNPDGYCYSVLMQVYTHAGGEQLAKIDSLQSEMQQLNVRLSFHDYDDLIRAADQSKLPAQVRRWSEAARAAGLFDLLDKASRNIVTQSSSPLSQSDPLADAPAASHSSASLAALPAVDSSAVLSQLRVALKMHDAAAAQRIISEHEQRGGKCEVAMLNQWISCHEKGADWQGAERVWKRIGELGLKPSNVSYRSLMQVYTSVGGVQLAKIDALLAEMQQNSVELSAKDYDHLIKRAHASKLPAEVRRWSEAARAAGLFDSLDEISRSITTLRVNQAPASSSLSTLTAADYSAVKSQLKDAMRANDAAAATRIIDSFEQRGGGCSATMLTQWITCHEKSGDWQGAEGVWARFGELNIKPDNVSYRALLRVYTSAGGEQLAKIDALLSEMQQNGVEFSVKDYEQLIQTAHRRELPAEVRRWSALARAAGVFGELDDASRGIVAHPANRQPSSAVVHVRPAFAASSRSTALPFPAATTGAAAAAIEPSAELRAALDNHNDATLVWRLLSDFELSGGCITTRMYARWLKCFVSSADWRGAEQAWAMLRHRSIQLDRRCYAALLQVYTRTGGDQLAKIDPLLSEMRRLSIALEWRDYDNLIGLAATAKLAPREVTRWAEVAQAAGLTHKLSELAQKRIRNAQQDSELQQRTQANEQTAHGESVDPAASSLLTRIIRPIASLLSSFKQRSQ